MNDWQIMEQKLKKKNPVFFSCVIVRSMSNLEVTKRQNNHCTSLNRP